MFRVCTLSWGISLASVAAVFAISPAYAADKSGVYVNIGVTQLSTDLDLTETDVGGQIVDLGDQSADITMITGRLGYRLNEYFALEGEAGFGVGGDNLDAVVPVVVAGTNINVDTRADLDVNNYVIGFGRVILPLSEQFDIFVRGGYGSAEAQADVTASAVGLTISGSESQRESGFAYGVGAEYSFTDNDGVRLDYTRLEDTNIISLSYARRF